MKTFHILATTAILVATPLAAEPPNTRTPAENEAFQGQVCPALASTSKRIMRDRQRGMSRTDASRKYRIAEPIANRIIQATVAEAWAYPIDTRDFVPAAFARYMNDQCYTMFN